VQAAQKVLIERYDAEYQGGVVVHSGRLLVSSKFVDRFSRRLAAEDALAAQEAADGTPVPSSHLPPALAMESVAATPMEIS